MAPALRLAPARVLIGGAVLALLAATSVATATGASAGQLDGDPLPVVAVVEPVPVDPQPVVAGHEGDVLMRVNVAMPATQVATAVKPRAKKIRR